MPDDAEEQAPPVVAVMVACDPGPWFEEALAALGAQDYPDVSVLVVDVGAEDVTPRVAAVLPTAFVRRTGENVGYAAAANQVLDVVEGASHYLFCHDDAAPAPDALRTMMEEAFRSNAGIVCPKLVDWDDPLRLRQVGMGADKSGAPSLLAEPGELDQEQHDAVRDVFVAPGGCTLVRADLFAVLGGFDGEMFLYGEDLDLSWRAQIAGARVVVAPGARARHLEAMSSGRRSGAAGPQEIRRAVRPYQLRHRLRAVLKDYSGFHLLRVLPQIAVLAVAEVVYGVVSGHRVTAGDIVGAWRWNLARRTEIRAARRAVRAVRALPDSEVRRLQARGSARFTAFVRGQLAVDGRLRLRPAAAPDARAGAPDVRLPVAVLAAVALVLAFGSRHLITGRIAAVGDMGRFPSNPWTGFLRPFLSGWRATGLGAEAPAPAAFGLLGAAGTLLLGATGLLRTILVVGALPAGAIGAFRLARPLGSVRARLVALVLYAALPLPYDALARGRWSGLLAYAAAPWVVARLLRATRLEPFGIPGARDWRDLLPLGVLTALLAAFAPSWPAVTLLAAVGLTAGALLVGEARAVGRSVAAAGGAALVAGLLLFPWTLDFLLPGTTWAGIIGVGPPAGRAFGLGALLRFQTGPLGAPPVGWAFLVVAALPLLVGRGWRLAWAGRLWAMALACWAVAWTAGRGWLPVPLPSPELVLAPAAVAMALCGALGMVAFEVDLPDYRFGWRQQASIAAAVAAVLAVIPVTFASAGGRWSSPKTDFPQLLSWMPEQQRQGAFRVLWLGDPVALPLGGQRLGRGVAYATSRNGPPDVTDRWPGASPESASLLGDAVRVARARGTARLGHLLAPLAVRYVVVPLAAAPSRKGSAELAPPADVTATLAAQVDLRQLEGNPSLLVYENAAWAPGRAALDPDANEASRAASAASAEAADLSGAKPVLPAQRSAVSYAGRLAAGTEVYLSEAASDRWELRSGGRRAPRREAFGWANAFTAEHGGKATLRYRTSPMRWAALLIELALWAAAIAVLVRRRRSRA